MPHEEWSDHVDQATQVANAIHQPISMIRTDNSATEVRLEGVQRLCVPFVLNHRELGEDLHSRRHLVMAGDSNMEAPFPIDEPGDPLRFELHVSIPNV